MENKAFPLTKTGVPTASESTRREDVISTTAPILITTAIAAIFVFTAFLFLVYDKLVERRQHLVMNTAEKSTAIVSSLFPKSVHERLLQNQMSSGNGNKTFASDKKRVESFLTGKSDGIQERKPIADLFPYTTVFFADISGKFYRKRSHIIRIDFPGLTDIV